MPSLRSKLQTFAIKINLNQVVDKPRLFIKPSDLIDGISKVTLSTKNDSTTLDLEKDVVSKGVLGKHGKRLVCLRCGGRSEKKEVRAIPGHVPAKWDIWERIWSSRCICGGLWRLVKT